MFTKRNGIPKCVTAFAINAVSIVLILLTTPGPAPAQRTVTPDYTVTQRQLSPTLDEFIVEEMNTKKSDFTVKEITFLPGDHVTFSGDGCVNRGGIGKTCYRWVNPIEGDGSPCNFYYGSVTVRGNPLLNKAQVRNVQGVEYDITRTAVLQVHYEDNDYHDNDDNDCKGDAGPANQCSGAARARLLVRVRHGGPPARLIPPKKYDLESSVLDGNNLMLNPMFHVQWISSQDDATGADGSAVGAMEWIYYTPDKIDSNSNWFKQIGRLTNQAPRYNTDAGYCPKLSSKIDGRKWDHVRAAGRYLSHVTYFPVSYMTQRPFHPEKVAVHEPNGNVLIGEMDFNVNVWPFPFKPGTNYLLHGETDGWEPLGAPPPPTVAIKSTPFWDYVWAGDILNPPLKNELHLIKGRRVFMTGLFNVDVFHDQDSGAEDQCWESHPVFALAVSDKAAINFDSSTREEQWHLFVRDRGQGGYCDRATKTFDFERDQQRGVEFFSFDLPVEDIQQMFTVDKIEITSTDLRLKRPAVHSITNATIAMVNSTTARLTLFFDRSLDKNNAEYFLAIGSIMVRYTWRQGFEGEVRLNVLNSTTPDTVELRWTDSRKDPTEYRVWRRRADGPPGYGAAPIAIVTPALFDRKLILQRWTDKKANAGAEYVYKVESCTAAGCRPSNEVRIGVGAP